MKLGLIGLALVPAQTASAQNGPVRRIVGFPPGGSADTAARLLADKMKDTLGVLVVVVEQPMVFKSIKYDTTKDFTPIGNATTVPLALAVGPRTPAKDMKELIAWLQA